jgi:hypothetical protein
MRGMRGMRVTRLAAAAAVWALLGCAGGATHGGTNRASRLTLTQEQLAGTNSDNLYDAIEKLRPDWLTSRGPMSVSNPAPSVVSVYMNGTMLGKAAYLKEMRVLDVSEVRFWDAGQASARFGMGHPRGVIEVTRK